jgi:hypothetical protein
MSRLVQIVADYGPDDLAHAELLGPGSGYSWSFAVAALSAVCRLDVTAGGSRPRPRDGLSVAVGHMHRRHPHAICDAVPDGSVPRLPERVVAYVDAAGDIATTRCASARCPRGPRWRGLAARCRRESGGSAAERFDRPRPGTSIRLRRGGARPASASRGRQL